jgi:hypothetical protein
MSRAILTHICGNKAMRLLGNHLEGSAETRESYKAMRLLGNHFEGSAETRESSSLWHSTQSILKAHTEAIKRGKG